MPEEQLIAVLRAELSQFRAGMEEAARVAQQAMRRVQEHSERAAKGIDSVEKSLGVAKNALAAFGVTVSAGALVTLATDAVQAALRMQALETSFKAVTGSATAAQSALEFARATANRLGQDVVTTTASFQRFLAATRGTALEGDNARRAFTQVAGAARALGLSVDDTNGIFVALTQSISKGTIQSEELRGQIGERLPGAFQIAARAMGVTTSELSKLVERGLDASAFITRFGDQLERELGAGAEEASRSAAAAFARLGNEIQTFAVNAGKDLLSILQPLAELGTKVIAEFNKIAESRRQLDEQFRRANPAAFAPIAPGAQATDVGPERARQSAALREDLKVQQEQLALLIQEAETTKSIVDFRRQAVQAGQLPPAVLFEANTQLEEANKRLADQRTRVDALQKAYAGVLDEQRKIKSLSDTGFPSETPLLPKVEDVELLRSTLKELGQELKAQEATATLFGGGFATDQAAKIEAQFDRAQDRLKALTKAAEDLAGAFTKSPGFLETLQPGDRKAVEQFATDLATARMRVDELTKAREAFKAGEQEAEKAAREAAAESERLAEKRVKDLGDVQKEQAKTAEAAKKAAFEEIKARAEVGVAEQEYLQGQVEAQEKLDVLAGRAQSRFDAERVRVRQQIADIEAVVGVTEDTQRVLADNLARIQREQTSETERELKKQNAAYEQFAENVQKTVGDRIFDVLSGRVRSFNDLLGSIKDTFLRVLADMAAAALARPIIIPAITAVLGAVGLGGELAGGGGAGGATGASGGGGGTLNTLLSLGRTGQQLYSLAGKLGLLGSGAGTGAFAGSTSFLGATAPTAFYATTPAAAATIATGGVGAGAGSTAFLGATAPTATFATTPAAGATVAGGAAAPSSAAAAAGISAVVGGVGAGIGTGLLASQLLGELGLKGTGNAVLSGAAGGATAGFIIGSAFPVIGNVVGAIAGALIGAIGGYVSTLFGGQAPPGVHLRGSTGRAPQFGVNEAGQIDLLQGFRPDVLGRQIPRAGLDQIGQAIDTASIAAIEPLIQTLRQFPESFQRNAVGPLNDLGQELKSRFADLRFSGDDVVEQVQKFLEETLPTVTQEVFDPFVKLIERLAPVFADLDTAIKALEQRRNEILADIIGVRATIVEGTLTPERLFARRRGQFDELLSTFRGATPEQQAALAPQVSRLAEDVFRQAQGLFREDTEALFTVQQDLLTVLDEVEFAVRKTFLDARDQIEDQIDVLNASFAIQQNIEAGIAESVALLQRIAALLTPIGSFQTAPGEFRRIPRTGLALVHEGEIIGRRGGGMATVTINIDARGSNDAAGIGRESAAAVRQTIRSLQQTSRYRQDRGR